ncbi:MAG: formylmethanofuran dehydrogenase subunit E family protein [Candidatus Omnitrophica bacterium]|nr:formylmethanofuran dehydrogenase subunit E family protein [Candidatus Omnitrophota bacterium]MDD5653656.1 formylmethanofuran dehydrogenase subunit E family protein [Candidatus Omnitrophota bacterium]
MPEKKISLKEAIRFHGHLGPYLVLGILAAEAALKKLKCRKYFGLEVNVFGANEKPKSCLIDGLQLASGATYGKGNINKFSGSRIRIEFKKKKASKRLIFSLKEELQDQLCALNGHADSEIFAKKLYCSNYQKLFNLQLTTGE